MDFKDIIRGEFGADALPETETERRVRQINEASDRFNAMNTDEQLANLEALALRLARMGFLSVSERPDGERAYAVAISQECLLGIEDEATMNGDDPENPETMSQYIASHLTIGHLPKGLEWDPEEWLVIYKFAKSRLSKGE